MESMGYILLQPGNSSELKAATTKLLKWKYVTLL